MLVSEYSHEWLSNLSLMGAVEPSTVRDYRNNLNAWHALADREVGDVTRRDVESAMMRMLSEGRSPSTVKKRLVTLRRMLRDAVDYGDIPSDPTIGVRNPKLRRTQKNYLPPDERGRLKAKIAESNSQVLVASAIALYAGLREAEVCGLRVEDVDLEAGVGWVRRAVGRSAEGTYEKSSKSGRERDFPIPGPLSDTLCRWVDSHEIRGGTYLLTGTDRWCDPTVLGRKWSQLCEVEGYRGILGKPPTFHDLRHTYATVAIAAGVDVKTVSSVLGHASAAMTLDVYAVADPVAKRMSAEVMAGAI